MKKKLIMLFLAVVSCTCLAFGLSACTGEAGATGATGATGAAGADGADGSSAYEIAVANGYTGTEAEWLASLTGATGAAGADGVGVSSVTLNEYNDFVVTYTDDSTDTLKYHGSKYYPYIITSDMYETAYDDTYGYLSFNETDYFTAAAGETVYFIVETEDNLDVYISGGAAEGDLEVACSDTDDSTISWVSADKYTYVAISSYNGGQYYVTVTNTTDEELPIELAIGMKSLELTYEETVYGTVTENNYSITATFTAPADGYYNFELVGDDKADVSVTGGGYDEDDNYYYATMNNYGSGYYSYDVYLPEGVELTFYCTNYNYEASATFGITVTESEFDYALTSSGLVYQSTTPVTSLAGSSSGVFYTFIVNVSGLYKFSIESTDTTTWYKVSDADNNGSDVGNSSYTSRGQTYTEQILTYYMSLSEGELIYIYAYGATNTISIVAVEPDATLTTAGLSNITLTAGQTYIISVTEGARYYFNATQYDSTATYYTDIATISGGLYGATLWVDEDTSSSLYVDEVDDTFTTGAYIFITAYYGCTISISTSNTPTAE